MAIDAKNRSSILSPYKPRKLALGEVDYMVRIEKDIIKSVVFLCVDELDKHNLTVRKPKATGFFVRVSLPKFAVDYIVTAKHCVDAARKYGSLYVRFNLKSGTYAEIPTTPDDWHSHPQADVAAILAPVSALPQGINKQDVDQSSLPMNSFVSADYTYEVRDPTIKGMKIRPDVGHQAYYIGLFTAEHHGQQRNLPIARFGHISRMPKEVKMRLPGDIEFTGIAYLIELQSWGGSSGAPAFFLYPVMVSTPKQLSNGSNVTARVDLKWVTGFMGLINGHYPFRQETVKAEYSPDIAIDLNTGIAVVTPAEAVRQLLMEDEELIEQRNRLQKEFKKNIPTVKG